MAGEFWCDECHNLGTVECHCGGDNCVCTNYGEEPCPKCGGGELSTCDDGFDDDDLDRRCSEPW